MSAWYRLLRRILYIFWQARIYPKHLDKLKDLHDISLSGGEFMQVLFIGDQFYHYI